MAPYDRQLREIRARLSELATERRRRERAAQVAQRAGVREAAKSGGMPSLAAALEAGEALFDDAAVLQTIRAFLSTGGEVGFGFATRPGTIAFTDGRRQRQARTWGEARSLYAEGWEPGAPGVPEFGSTWRAAGWSGWRPQPTSSSLYRTGLRPPDRRRRSGQARAVARADGIPATDGSRCATLAPMSSETSMAERPASMRTIRSG